MALTNGTWKDFALVVAGAVIVALATVAWSGYAESRSDAARTLRTHEARITTLEAEARERQRQLDRIEQMLARAPWLPPPKDGR